MSDYVGHLFVTEQQGVGMRSWFSNPVLWLLIFSVMPGSATASYLHSSRPIMAILYGVVVIITGWALPTIAVLIAFFGLLGILSLFASVPETFATAVTNTLTMIYSALLVGSPFLAIVIIFGGIIGGVLGLVLRYIGLKDLVH